MCYTQKISFLFTLIGIGVACIVHINQYAFPKKMVSLILFYTLMEAVQTIQYFVVNQCDNFINITLTNLAYLLVIAQPLLWNYYFYKNSQDHILHAMTFQMAMFMYIPWLIINLSSKFSLIYGFNKQTKDISIYAGNVCTKRNNSHLYWEWESDNYKDLNANMLMYLTVWFVPALIIRKTRATIFIVIMSALTGWYMTYRAGELEIFTSAWCYISIPTVATIVLKIFFDTLFASKIL